MKFGRDISYFTLEVDGFGLLLLVLLGTVVDTVAILTFVIVFFKLSNEFAPSKLTRRPKSLSNLPAAVP